MRTTHPHLARAAGPLLPLLDDPQIREIRCTSAGRVFAIHAEHGKQRHPDLDPEHLHKFVGLVAHEVHAEWRDTAPTLHAASTVLGIRVQASRPPVSPGPQMVLRKHPSTVYPLASWVTKGILTTQQSAVLQTALRDRQTIVISGAVGSSKTSLLNALLHELRDTEERLVVCEDDPEIVCAALDCEFQRTSRDTNGQVVIDMAALCRDLLRLSPDRVIIGELRGKEALTTMQAFSTGHPGLCTVHAPSAAATPRRLEQLVGLESQSPQRALIAEAVNVVCHMEAYGRRWRCTNILAVGQDLDREGHYRTRSLLSP